MPLRRALLLFQTAVVLAVAPAATVPGDDAAPRPSIEVRWFGALREIIHQGHREGRARLADAMHRPHGYALGALAGLDGEFVVLDGRAHLSRPDGRGGVRNATSEAGEDSVALMVFARVEAWRTLPVTRPITLGALQDTLAARAPALGLSPGGPFPFLVEGGLSGLRWHVVDGRRIPPGSSDHEVHQRAGVTGARDTVTATLLGFYSDHHAGVFLHHDLDVHVHVLLPREGIAAHVDSVMVGPGAMLRLPLPR